MSDYPQAVQYLVSDDRIFPGQNAHKAIVLHGTGGNPYQTAEQLGDYFRVNADKVSVNYGIDRNGAVYQYVREADGAGGNCCIETGYDTYWQDMLEKYTNLNLCTISIEHVNDKENSLPLTAAQQNSSFDLVLYLCKKYGLTHDDVRSHASIATLTRARCPGNYPWAALFTYLDENYHVPLGWIDKDEILTAPNGISVRQGFRDYVLSHNWPMENWPLEEEHGQSPLEKSNLALGSGTQQVFRTSMLGWTPQRGVFEEWIGQELLYYRSHSGIMVKS